MFCSVDFCLDFFETWITELMIKLNVSFFGNSDLSMNNIPSSSNSVFYRIHPQHAQNEVISREIPPRTCLVYTTQLDPQQIYYDIYHGILRFMAGAPIYMLSTGLRCYSYATDKAMPFYLGIKSHHKLP